jgi:hypothetical protein
MDQDEILTRLIGLSRANFRRVVALVLRRVFGFKLADIDATGDGGNDWSLFGEAGQRIALAVQDTVQLQQWDAKALSDAKTVTASHEVNRFFFCTNRAHKPVNITKLEERIRRETDLDTTVLDGRHIASFIFEEHLESEFLEAIGSVRIRKPLAMPEIALCSYLNISADRRNHRDEIYRDTLMSVCRENQPIGRAEILNKGIEFLGSEPEQRILMDRQIDWLLSQRQLLWHRDTQEISLSEDANRRIDQSERLYLNDWSDLEGALTAVLTNAGGSWNASSAEQATVLLARMFMNEQLNGLRAAGVELQKAGWSGRLGDPRQKLRDLLQRSGVPIRKLSSAISELVDLAKARPVINKLTRTAFFAPLEGRDPVQSSAALNASSWDEVNVLLDASVAIPLLCTRLTEYVDKYLYAVSSRSVDVLLSLGVTCFIAPGHLEECASHLLRALRYQPLEERSEFSAALRFSENAFVAFYYALKAEGRRAPPSLDVFLRSISRSAPYAARNARRWSDAVTQVMPDLQVAFAQYNVHIQHLDRVARDRYDVLQRAHDLILIAEHRKKSDLLRIHDLHVLAHLDARTLTHDEPWLFLTWDKTMMGVAKRELQRGWIVSPEVAMDFAQPCRNLSETQWSSLAHKLAKVSSPSESLTARIIDNVARLRGDLLQDWEFLNDIAQFRDEALDRVPTNADTDLQSWIERESDTFLRGKQVIVDAGILLEDEDELSSGDGSED